MYARVAIARPVEGPCTYAVPAALAGRVALLHAVLAPGLLLLTVRLAGDGPLTARDAEWTGLAALCFIVPFVAIAFLVGPEVPSLGGALIGGVAFVLLLRRREPGQGVDARGLLPDLAPYLAILALVLVSAGVLLSR